MIKKISFQKHIARKLPGKDYGKLCRMAIHANQNLYYGNHGCCCKTGFDHTFIFFIVHSYRLQSNPEGLIYDEHLSKHKGFNNPRNIETLTELLGIDTSAPCSLLRCFQRYGTPEVSLHEVTHLVFRAVRGNDVHILEYFALKKMVAFCFMRRLCILNVQ